MQFVLTSHSSWRSFSLSKFGALRPPRSACFHHLHPTRSISVVLSSLESGFKSCVNLESGVWAAWLSTSVDVPLSEEWRCILNLAAEESERLGQKHVGAGSCQTHLHRAGMGQDCRKNRRCPIRRQRSRLGDPGLGSARKTGETESRLCSRDYHSDSETGRLDNRAGSSHRPRAPILLGSCLTWFLRLPVLEPPLADRAAKVPESGPVP